MRYSCSRLTSMRAIPAGCHGSGNRKDLAELATMLPVGLPAIAPFEHWRIALATNLASWRSISVRPGHHIVTQAMPWRPALVLLALLRLADEHGHPRFPEFFAVTTRHAHTRRADARSR